MDNHFFLLRARRLSGAFAIFGLAAMAAILLCMFTYARPYEWEHDFLSAMGLTRLPQDEGGLSNYFTCALFNLTLIGCGLMSSAYFILRGGRAHGLWRKILIILFGIIGGIGLIGIGCVPFNWNGPLHNAFTMVAVAGFAPAILFVSTEGKNIFGTPFENLSALAFLVYAFLIWYGLWWCLHKGELPGHEINPILQKIMILAFWFYMMHVNLRLYLNARRALKEEAASAVPKL